MALLLEATWKTFAVCKKNIMAVLYHISSSADSPNHSMCADDGWCEYNKNPENCQHYEGIPMCVVDLIEPIYIYLSGPLLLSRCAHGKTQNSNKSFNSIQCFFIFAQISIHRNKFDSSGQKKETMAKRYTLIQAHEKNLD